MKKTMIIVMFLVSFISINAEYQNVENVKTVNTSNETSSGDKNDPGWAVRVPLNESIEFIVSVNEGRKVNDIAKQMATVFLARLHSSYVVRYEAFLKKENDYLPLENKVDFSVVVAEDADQISKNYENKIFQINTQAMDSFCYVLFSSPDSVDISKVDSESIKVPELNNNDVLSYNGYVFSQREIISHDINAAADMAFKECLHDLGQFFVVDVEARTLWSERVINDRDPAGFGESFITMESKYRLKDVKIIKLTAFHEVKKNLHYYKVSITLMKKI